MIKRKAMTHLFGSTLLAATVLLWGGGACAQEKTDPQAAPVQEIKDQRALDLLKGMSDTLAKAQILSFKVRSLVPFATPSGQQISLFGSSRVAMQRPDKLFVETRGDLFPHNLYFNGKTVTAVGVEKRFYAQLPAAASSIEALIQKEHPGSDALAPFVDLLVADPYTRLTKNLSSALLVGQFIGHQCPERFHAHIERGVHYHQHSRTNPERSNDRGQRTCIGHEAKCDASTDCASQKIGPTRRAGIRRCVLSESSTCARANRV